MHFTVVNFPCLFIQSQLGGKLLIFQNTLPSLGVGRLKLRGDDSKVYGTDKEHVLRLPEDPFYKQMAAEFSKCQILVNIPPILNHTAQLSKIMVYSFNKFMIQKSKWSEDHEN